MSSGSTTGLNLHDIADDERAHPDDGAGAPAVPTRALASLCSADR